MGGSRLILSAIGTENDYLTVKPSINFFKSVYNHYSNFAMQFVRMNFNKDVLDLNEPTELKLKLEKNGDLISQIYLEINIPDVLSNSLMKDIDMTNPNQLRWINQLGFSMIKNIKINIGGNVIEEYDGEYIYIYYQTSQTNEKVELINEISGNTDFNYNPNKYLENKYPNYSKNKTFNKDNKKFIDSNFENSPSIKKQKLRIPIPFWFCRDIGNALPIMNLEYHDANIILTIRPIKELVNLVDSKLLEFKNPIDDQLQPLNGNNNINNYNIFHHQHTTSDLINKTDDILKYFTDDRWILDPHLDVNYIYLDKKEKLWYNTVGDLSYLVEPMTKLTFENQSGYVELKAELYSQVKELIIIGRRNDISKRNKWMNFTNFDDELETNYLDFQNNFYRISYEESKNHQDKSPIYFLGAFVTDDNKSIELALKSDEWNLITENSNVFLESKKCYNKNDIINFLKIWKYRSVDDIPYINKNNIKFYNRNIIENIKIIYDTIPRLDTKQNKYFNVLQPYMHHNNNYDDNQILIYSFSLNPDDHQPSGKCNFNHIKNVTFNMQLKEPNKYETTNYLGYKYNIYIYSKYFNIIKFNNGMCDLLFKK